MFPGVPPIYKALADSPKAREHDLRSIRLCVSGAMKLPTEVAEQFTRISGAALVEGYGMTETSPSTHCNPVGAPRAGLDRPAAARHALQGRVAGRPVRRGRARHARRAGRSRDRRSSAATGAARTSTGVFTDDGYVLTGDVAVMDEDGYFAIVDRKKELIIAGGFNIYPSEVEEVLFALPGVQDAVVIGVPDKYRGETVKAFVVTAPGASLSEADVVEHCRASLTAYKVPKLVEFRDALPRTVVGKVLRRVLVEEEREKAEKAAAAKPASVPPGARKAQAAAAKPEPQQDGVDEQPAAPAPAAKRAAAAKKAPARKAPARKVPAAKAPAAKAPAQTVAAKATTSKAPAAKVPAKAATPGATGVRKRAAAPRRSD